MNNVIYLVGLVVVVLACVVLQWACADGSRSRTRTQIGWNKRRLGRNICRGGNRHCNRPNPSRVWRSLRLSFSSPYDGEGMEPAAFAIAAGLYLLWVQVMGFFIGGYVTARLRARARSQRARS